MTRLEQVVVVGASIGGLRAVEVLRRAGYEGALTLIGAEESLPYDRPPLSKQILLGTWDVDRAQLRGPRELADLGVEVRLGTRAIELEEGDRLVRLSTGEALRFDGMVLACGVEPRRLPWRLPGVQELRTIEEAASLRGRFAQRPRVAIVGAGFIGGEVASAARAQGLEVTVIEREPCPFATSLGPGLGHLLGEIYRSHGVSLRCGVTVVGLKGKGRVEAVELSNGEVVEVDVVVGGIGTKPATDWLLTSAVKLADGVVCDPFCETTVPRVYACGDVARWPNPLFGGFARVEHWTNAVEQARCAAENLVRGDRRRYEPVPYFWSDQFGLKLQSAGSLTNASEYRVLDEAADDRRLLSLFGRAGRVVGVFGINCPALVGKARRDISERRAWSEVVRARGVAREDGAAEVAFPRELALREDSGV